MGKQHYKFLKSKAVILPEPYHPELAKGFVNNIEILRFHFRMTSNLNGYE